MGRTTCSTLLERARALRLRLYQSAASIEYSAWSLHVRPLRLLATQGGVVARDGVATQA